MEIRLQTHRSIDPRLSGTPVELAEGRATVRLETTAAMAADEKGLVHGGFVFSAADHAAMLAVNHPNVVLGESRVRFLRPLRVGTVVEAEAELGPTDGKKHPVHVVVRSLDASGAPGDKVCEGEFTCFVPPQHVLQEDPEPAPEPGDER